MSYTYVASRRTVHLGEAWAGNIVNCVPYRADGLTSRAGETWGAFYDHLGGIALFQIAAGRNARIVRTASPLPPDDAHRALSIAFDRDRILAIGGAHASDPFQLAFDAQSLELRDAPQLVRGNDRAFTYPTFCRDPTGDTLLLMRVGVAHRSHWRIWRLNGDAWIPDEEPLVNGMAPPPLSAGPYLSKPFEDGVGRFWSHLVWRMPPSAAGCGLVNNVGVDLLGSSDGWRSVHNLEGTPLLARPIVPSSSERIFAVPLNRGLLNQTGGATSPGLGPVIASCWSEPWDGWQYRLIRPDKNQWLTTAASDFVTEIVVDGKGTLALPHSRPELLFTPEGDAIVIFRSAELGGRLAAHRLTPPDFDIDRATRMILWDEDLGEYEPVIDRQAWTDEGVLRVYLQWAEQVTGSDGVIVDRSASCFVADWVFD